MRDEHREAVQAILDRGGPEAVGLTALLVEFADFKGRAQAADQALNPMLKQISRMEDQIERLRKNVRIATRIARNYRDRHQELHERLVRERGARINAVDREVRTTVERDQYRSVVDATLSGLRALTDRMRDEGAHDYADETAAMYRALVAVRTQTYDADAFPVGTRHWGAPVLGLEQEVEDLKADS